jgi:hypothetical protein
MRNLCRLVADEGRAFSAEMMVRGRGKLEHLAHPVLGKVAPHASFTFCVISADGTLEPPHLNASGFFTMSHVMHGRKLVVFGTPKMMKPSTIRHLHDSWELLRDPTLLRGAVLLNPGDVLWVVLTSR